MWVKIRADVGLNMDIELTGVSERTRDSDVQLHEETIKNALRERLSKVFNEDDVAIHDVRVGIAREKYIGRKAA